MQSDNGVLVSIITPSYNQGRFIEETILSVKNQDYPNIEHIVVDGGSVDNTLDILKEYEGTYNLRWISEPDEGQADAINKGFGMANGGIIGWLNSDDMYFSTDVISHVIQQFRDNKSVDILYGHAVKVNARNRLMRIKVIPEFNYKHLKRLCYIVQPSVFFKKKVVEQEKLNISLQYSMDYEYWLRLGRKFTWKRTNRILSVDRNHESRKIISNAEKSVEDTKKVREQYGFYSTSFWALQLIDKFRLRWRRVAGLMKLNELRRNRNYAFPIEFDGIFITIWHQIFRDDCYLL